MAANCHEATRLKMIALAGDASDAQRDLVRRHAVVCRDCAREWSALEAVANALRSGAPPAFRCRRHPLEALAEAQRRTGSGARLPRRAIAWAAMTVLLVITWGALPLVRPSRASRALADVEAAASGRLAHWVERIYDHGTGELKQTIEQWRSPTGDRYWTNTNHRTGTRRISLYRYRDNVVWSHMQGENQYELGWSSSSPRENWLPDPTRDDPVSRALTRLRSYDVDLNVSERRGEFGGEAVRIVEISVPAGALGTPHPQRSNDKLWTRSIACYLTYDGSRLVRQTLVSGLGTDRSPLERFDKSPVGADHSGV